MSIGKLAGSVVGLILATALLGACSSDEPPTKSSASPKATATTRDADGFTPAEREVVDAVEAYNKAFFGRGATPVETAIEPFVTKAVLDGLGPAETKAVDDAGLQRIGTATLVPEQVTIDGDTAILTGCKDASRAFIVKKGETTAGVGSKAGGVSRITFGLVRQDGRWLVGDPRGEPVDAC